MSDPPNTDQGPGSICNKSQSSIIMNRSAEYISGVNRLAWML